MDALQRIDGPHASKHKRHSLLIRTDSQQHRCPSFPSASEPPLCQVRSWLAGMAPTGGFSPPDKAVENARSADQSSAAGDRPLPHLTADLSRLSSTRICGYRSVVNEAPRRRHVWRGFGPLREWLSVCTEVYLAPHRKRELGHSLRISSTAGAAEETRPAAENRRFSAVSVVHPKQFLLVACCSHERTAAREADHGTV